MKHLTLFNRNVRLQCSSLLERLDLLDEIDEIESTTEASNSKPSVREHWLIVLKNFSFSYGCDSWINRLLFLNSKLSLRENWLTVLINFLFSCGCDKWITRLLFLEMWAWAASADIIRGLFAWRWGIPGRWGNPPRWGNQSFHIISHFILITFTW